MEKSFVTAIYKSGGRCDPMNYRPVFLNCVGCKILESIIKDALVNYFKVNNLFYINQYGFLKNKSCSV